MNLPAIHHGVLNCVIAKASGALRRGSEASKVSEASAMSVRPARCR